MQSVSSDRCIEIIGDVNTDSIKNVMGKLRELVEKDREAWINFFITSPGGEAIVGFALYDLALMLKPKLQTIGLGRISSMGVSLFLMGEYRVIGPRASIFLHEVGSQFRKDVRLSVSQHRRELQKSENTQRIYREIIAERTGGKITADQAIEMMLTETLLDAPKAVELGFAHEILR